MSYVIVLGFQPGFGLNKPPMDALNLALVKIHSNLNIFWQISKLFQLVPSCLTHLDLVGASHLCLNGAQRLPANRDRAPLHLRNHISSLKVGQNAMATCQQT
jgi:hypothetical protein